MQCEECRNGTEIKCGLHKCCLGCQVWACPMKCEKAEEEEPCRS